MICPATEPTHFETPYIDQLAAGGQSVHQRVLFCLDLHADAVFLPHGQRTLFAARAPALRRRVAPSRSFLANTPTIASLLRARRAISTAVIGKWHLGLGGPEERPDWNGELKAGPARDLVLIPAFLLADDQRPRAPGVREEIIACLNLDPKDPLWVGNEEAEPGSPHRHHASRHA